MKFLQIKKHRLKEEQIPRILEMGVDFDRIIYNQMEGIVGNLLLCDRPENPTKDEYYSKNIAFISDCYQSRPLIEIDGYCEFSVYLHNDCEDDTQDEKMVIYEKTKSGFIMIDINCEQTSYGKWFDGTAYDIRAINDIEDYKDLGSIFKPENQLKYPELYAIALTLI
jgi:hypothetical protein